MSGEELLIADSSDRDREGLRKLFDDQGYVCTGSAQIAAAQDLVRRKFFPAAVIDLDFGGTGGGIEFARFVQQTSRPTRIVLLAGRRSFEAAVDALRLGAVDVVAKRPDQIEYLQETVRRATDLSHSGEKGGALMGEVRVAIEDALRIMLAMARKVYGAADNTSAAGFAIKPAILLIDEDQQFLRAVAQKLAGKPWDLSVELSGGSGLDKASTFSFQIVAVREELSDLPGQMLLRSAQSQQPQVLGLSYSLACSRAERFEGGRSTRSWPVASVDELVRCLDELVGELGARREERRYMQAFRNEHGAFLKRFADLKVRIDALGD